MAFDLLSGKNLLKTNYQISRYALQAVGNQIVNRKNDQLKRRRALEITADNSKQVLKNLGVKIETHYIRENLLDRNYFMVCNHMSYIDILVLSSIQPAVFVTSVEMEKTFFLGDMAKLGGSFFVDRVNRRKMKSEVQALVQLLKDQFNVFIFPEGTSTNGTEILPFKKSLFRVPFQTQFPILPICLKYKTINGEPFSLQNCDRVCWYDDMTFAPHFLQLMGLRELIVEVHYLDPLDPKNFANHGDLALAAREQIVSVYQG
ncbi:MAG: lysophospholipid acyltransferase family protein [Pseudomonadota bacterium]